MRVRTRRRSTSICFSPGPRRPMPARPEPTSRFRWVHRRFRRGRVLHLGQLDLDLRERAAGPTHEDVEDQLRPIDHPFDTMPYALGEIPAGGREGRGASGPDAREPVRVGGPHR